MKFAYLIVAHNNFYVLNTLLKMLDDQRNDIYLHIDAKCQKFDFNNCRKIVNKSNIYFVERHDISWGDYSLIEAELTLFSKAHQHGGYAYYHLLSGSDLPIKSQNYIHDFFGKNYGYEFITCANESYTENCDVIARFNTYRNSESKIHNLLNKLNYMRYKNDFIISFGSEWVSVTDNFVEFILKRKRWIKKHFKYSYTCDEVYKQCIALNTDFRDKLYRKCDNNNTISFNMRLIDWSAGGAHPKTFTMNDVERIFSSECLFARKFDEQVDKNIVDYIYTEIISEM